MKHVLITPKSYLKLFAIKQDRQYFSKPVPIEILFSDVGDKLLWVKDLNRGKIFPVKPENVKTIDAQ